MRPRLLVVDDHPFVREGLGQLLRSESYDVDFAATASYAFELIGARDYDLVITDLHLGEESGFDLFRKIKADSTRKDLPVIALTMYDVGRHRKRLVKAGFRDMISKVTTSKELVRVIRRELTAARDHGISEGTKIPKHR